MDCKDWFPSTGYCPPNKTLAHRARPVYVVTMQKTLPVLDALEPKQSQGIPAPIDTTGNGKQTTTVVHKREPRGIRMAADLWRFVESMAELKGVSAGRAIEQRVREWRDEVIGDAA